MNRRSRQRTITRALILSVCLVWAYIGVRIWSVSSTRPSPVARTSPEVFVVENRRLQSGSDTFVGNFRDPFLGNAADSSLSLTPTDSDNSPDQISTDAVPDKPSDRYQLVGLVSKTAIIQSTEGHPFLVTVGDSLGVFRINSMHPDHVELGSTDGLFDLYFDGHSADFSLATNQKNNP